MASRPSRDRMSRFRGATLVELLVAVIILSVGLLPLVLAMNKIFTNTYSMGTRSEAQLLAAEKVDELKSYGFATLEDEYLAGADSVVLTEDTAAMKPYVRTTLITYQKAKDSTFVDVVAADTATNYIKMKTTVMWATDTSSYSRSLTAMVTREGALE
jgi:Tfp pilus assembly protein PilV